MRIKLWGITLFFIITLLVPNMLFLQSENLKVKVTGSKNIINNLIKTPIEANDTKILQNLNKINDFFTENRGQIGNASVRYYIQGKGVWFLDDGVVFEIREEISIDSRGPIGHGQELKFQIDPLARVESMTTPKYRSITLKLNFENANQIVPKGQKLLQHRSNFFYGNDSSKWYTNVLNYQEIFYENIYDNIDLKYYTTPKGLKYDFIVHPEGDIKDIKMKYTNVQRLFLDNSGNLNIQTPLGNLLDSNLDIYQNIDNEKKNIKGKFKELDSTTFGFEINGKYDKNIDLIIDPLIFSTFIGGSGGEFSRDLAIDKANNVYVTGHTGSPDFPSTSDAFDTNYNGGNLDVFILKLNSFGSDLLYSTFIGGSDSEGGNHIEIDAKNNVYVTGITRSSNFPITNNIYDNSYNGEDNIFILKLNSKGSSLIYSTLIGGSSNDRVYDTSIDKKNNLYITGTTNSVDFPTTEDAFDRTFNGDTNVGDAFILKFNLTNSLLIYSTYFGGNGGDYGLGIVNDLNDNMIITGQTNSSDFPSTINSYDPTYNGEFDVFVAKFNYNGSELIFSTFIGTGQGDWSRSIALDSQGEIYIIGLTESSNFPVTPDAYDNSINGYYDIVILKLDSTGSFLIYSTFFGGNHQQSPSDIKIDLNDNIFVIGSTYSSDFPNTTDAFDNNFNGYMDAFVLMMNPTCSSLLYSTYIGGASYDEAIGIEIDPNRNIYITGLTSSANFPNMTNSYDPTFNGYDDSFVLKLDMDLKYNFPSIIDFNLSKETITRTNSIYLFSNTTDVEDQEKDLSIQFEYKEPNENIWKNIYFSSLQYKNSRWEVIFTPPKNAKLGLYDFRVRAIDKDLLFSTWYYLDDALMVSNNIPVVENIGLSKDKILSGKSVLIWINGNDVEESEEDLTVELEYNNTNELSWNANNLDKPQYLNERWEYIFNIPSNSSFGIYNFRARFNDSDGNYSNWIYANDLLSVYNEQPTILDLQLSNRTVYRTHSIFLYVNVTDYETPENMLKFYTQYKQKNMDKWTVINGNYSNLNHRWESRFNTTIQSALGIYGFRVRLENNETLSTSWSYLNNSLNVLNNPPEISDNLDNIKVGFEPRSIELSKFGIDIEDNNENITWGIEQNSIDKTLFSASIIGTTKNILKVIPLENASGIDDITLILKDKDEDIDIKTDITLYIGNAINRYYNVNISVIPDIIDTKQGKSHNVTLIITNIGSMSDNYTISYDINSFLANDIQLEKNLILLDSSYKVRVNVTINVSKVLKINTYKINFKVESYFVFNDTVLKINIEKDDFKNQKKENNLIFIIIILILIIILVLIFMSIINRRKKQKVKLLSMKNISIKPSAQTLTNLPQNQISKPNIKSEISDSITPKIAQQPDFIATPKYPQVGKLPITSAQSIKDKIIQGEAQPKLPAAKSQHIINEKNQVKDISEGVNKPSIKD